MPSDILRVFREHGALLEGHFGLTSGRHSPIYLQCALVLSHPQVARDLGSRLVGSLLENIGGSHVDVVVSPAVGGIVIGQEVAASLGARAIFSERVDGKMAFRRGFFVRSGEKVVAVEDVVTTGGSIREAAQLAQASGGDLLATASIIHRYTEKPVDPTPLTHVSLVQINAPAYEPAQCPLCLKKIPLEKPGSRHLSSPKQP